MTEPRDICRAPKPTGDLLDPKNDYVFKRLFVRRPQLLVALINAVRPDAPPVRCVEIRNPGIDGEELGAKAIVLDILAQDESGHIYDIEMQVRETEAWNLRSLFYLARLLGQELHAGQDYTQTKPVMGIHWLDFELFTEDAAQRQQAVWRFQCRDRDQPRVCLSEHLTVYMIELPKADRLGCLADRAGAAVSEPLARWVDFFKHWREEQRMSAHHYPPVQEALDELKRISADEQERYRALARERAVADAITERNAALRRGRIEGKIEGKIEGEAALLERLITRRFGPPDAATLGRIRSATIEQLEHWGDRILDAPTLEAVFDDH